MNFACGAFLDPNEAVPNTILTGGLDGRRTVEEHGGGSGENRALLAIDDESESSEKKDPDEESEHIDASEKDRSLQVFLAR